MDKRFGFYAETADIVINTNEKSIEQIITKLVESELNN